MYACVVPSTWITFVCLFAWSLWKPFFLGSKPCHFFSLIVATIRDYVLTNRVACHRDSLALAFLPVLCVCVWIDSLIQPGPQGPENIFGGCGGGGTMIILIDHPNSSHGQRFDAEDSLLLAVLVAVIHSHSRDPSMWIFIYFGNSFVEHVLSSFIITRKNKAKNVVIND